VTGDDRPRCSAGPISLDLGLCKACGICVVLCPRRVFDRDDLGYPGIVRHEDCTQCLICELHCPDFAIAIERRVRAKTATAASADPCDPATEDD
jgi:2-oxoglutarate ferredoxin oxidoreductase subunit delta